MTALAIVLVASLLACTWMLLPKHRATPTERLAAEEARTGCTTTTWWSTSDLTWRCRIDGMSGYWVALSEDDARRILADELRRVPTAA